MRPPARPRVAPSAAPTVKAPVKAPVGRTVTAGGPSGARRDEQDLTPWQEPRGWSPRRAPVVSTGSAARFAERTARHRRLLRDRALLVVGSAFVLAGLAWLLLASPALALRPDAVTIEVEGTGKTVDPAAVRAVVDAQSGTPLPRLDTVALRRDVLEVPGVRAATVVRVWPHGLDLHVVARDPVAAVPADGGGLVLVDQDGVPVGRTDTAPDGLPVVSVPLDGDLRAMTAVLVVLQQLPADLAAQVAGVAATNRDAVILTLRDGAVVEWGSSEQSALKAKVLATLRAAPSSAGVKVFDVSAPTLPITRS